MSFSIIVAVANNLAIGKDNALPWHLPADLKYFKSVTMGKPILMGRKTFESIGRPLPGRQNIVLTRDKNWHADDVTIVHDYNEAALAVKGVDEIMVIGGAQIYASMLENTACLYVTEVDCHVDGDAFFPEINPEIWSETSREQHSAIGSEPAYSFVVYERR